MGYDAGSLAGGYDKIQEQIAAVEENTTFATLTVTGATDLQGTVTVSGLPTADPTVEGELWNDSNSAAISAGE